MQRVWVCNYRSTVITLCYREKKGRVQDESTDEEGLKNNVDEEGTRTLADCSTSNLAALVSVPETSAITTPFSGVSG